MDARNRMTKFVAVSLLLAAPAFGQADGAAQVKRTERPKSMSRLEKMPEVKPVMRAEDGLKGPYSASLIAPSENALRARADRAKEMPGARGTSEVPRLKESSGIIENHVRYWSRYAAGELRGTSEPRPIEGESASRPDHALREAAGIESPDRFPREGAEIPDVILSVNGSAGKVLAAAGELLTLRLYVKEWEGKFFFTPPRWILEIEHEGLRRLVAVSGTSNLLSLGEDVSGIFRLRAITKEGASFNTVEVRVLDAQAAAEVKRCASFDETSDEIDEVPGLLDG
ncbi:MAG: hypothetical protein AB1486_28190 [Planctomycetota bacterium]